MSSRTIFPRSSVVTGLDTDKPTGDLGPQMAVRIDQRLDKATELLEAAMIKHALRQSRGHVATAAASLGISRKGLYRKAGPAGSRGFQPGNQPIAVDRRADPVPNHLHRHIKAVRNNPVHYPRREAAVCPSARRRSRPARRCLPCARARQMG